ncbi:MAG: hypothetical protein SGI73_00640 [Chloroflexota bacterium]|nr:hypothetical protein [Chloroflexota bacterium]
MIAQSPVYQEVYEFLASSPMREQILAFRPSEATQARIRTLLDAEKTGGVSSDERAELDEFEQVEHFVRMLKLHTRQLMGRD